MAKSAKKKTSFFEIIKKDLLFLNSSLHSIVPSLIGNIIVHCDDKKRFIGYNIGTITIDDYLDKLIEIADNCKYTFSLFDGSLICALYCFDENENILSFSLSFLPNVESDTLFCKGLSFYKGEYYIRIDFEPGSFVENTHSKVHMHTTLSKKGLRIPVNKIVLLSEFLYFVLKTVYGFIDLDALSNHISDIKEDINLENQLTENELSTFFLHC